MLYGMRLPLIVKYLLERGRGAGRANIIVLWAAGYRSV